VEKKMSTRRIEKSSNLTLLPLLAGLVVLCLIVAAVLTALTRSSSPVAAPGEQLALVVQRMPFEAQNALRGEPSAFDSLAKSVARLKSLRGSTSGAGDAAGWTKLTDGVTAVLEARPAVEAIQASNQEVRELAPKLLSELGDLGSSVGVQKLEGMSRYLERFELTVQRIQQDLNGLGSGVSDAGPSSQRLADSLEFLNQVIRGLSGEESGIAIQKVTGADPEARLKTVVQRNQQYNNSVRKAIGAADALSKAQAAARGLPALASTLATQLGTTAPRAESGGNNTIWILAFVS
jgi:twitching motility protein PilJ